MSFAAPTPAPTPPGTESAHQPGQSLPTQLRLQILSTEHWSLLSSRSLAWNESFSRAGMFLSTLSFAVVALALVAQASGFGETFRLFALVVLPVVLFVGITTSLRLDNANYHDLACVSGMNRIRAGYLELAPDLERFFVMGTTDDREGITRTMALHPGRSLLTHSLAATPSLIAVLNAVLFAAIVAILLMQVGASTGTVLTAAGLAFVLAFVAQAVQWRRQLNQLIREYHPLFPGPGSPG